jgi:hypothetical protein
MSSLYFSLSSEEAARLADRELRRNGVAQSQIRILDKLSRIRIADAARDTPHAIADLNREVAQGRVLLEVTVDDQNHDAVERVVSMLFADARRLLIPRAIRTQEDEEHA